MKYASWTLISKISTRNHVTFCIKESISLERYKMRRSRSLERNVRNVRPRTLPPATITWNGLAFGVHPTFYSDGKPNYVKITPIWRNGDSFNPVAYLRTLAKVLKNEATTIVQRYYSRVGIERRPNRVGGLLVVDQGSTMAVTRNYERLLIKGINAQKILEVIERTIVESSGDWSPASFELSFVFDQRAFVFGAGGPAYSLPSYFPKLMQKHVTLKTYTDPEGELSCLAVALSFGMGDENGEIFTYRTTKSKEKFWLERAREIQTNLGWGAITSIDQIEEFVEEYKQYRVCLFTPSNFDKPETFTGSEFDVEGIDLESSCPRNMIFLYLIPGKTRAHFCFVANPKILIRNKYSPNASFCFKCCIKVGRVAGHECLNDVMCSRKKYLICKYCKGPHQATDCTLFQCKECKQFRNLRGHRCRVISNNFKKKNIDPHADQVEIYQVNGCQDGKKNALIVWDIESQLEEYDKGEHTIGFEEDEEGYYTEETVTQIKTYKIHKPVMVCIADVYSDFKQTFTGEDCIARFLAFLKQYNKGKVIAIAHNSAKYDTRLVFNHLLETPDSKCYPICRGTKILQLNWENVIFRDSFLHLPNALKVLAKSMGLDPSLQKGFFPHLFNKPENFTYEGPIPDPEYFDLPFDPNGYPEFDQWYQSMQGTRWNLLAEMEKYCIQDVQVLKEIVKRFDESTRKGVPFIISPWSYATAPAFVHDLHVQFVNFNDEDSYSGPDDENMKKDYMEYLAKEKTWATLLDEEYRFARKALRGGRTDVRKLYKCLTPEEIESGRRIRYQDIVSMYPYQQVAQDFPVGVPTIYVFDKTAGPCIHSFYKICGCNQIEEKLIVKHEPREWSVQEILSRPNFFGFICADVTAPNNLYHPLLPVFDEESIKCTFPVGPITGRQVFTSIEFKKALEHGYQIDKLYRYDEYHKAPPLWADMVKKCYLEKMRNSRNAPVDREREELQEYYETHFDMPELKFDHWEKNPVMKLVAKIMVNVGWGKHAQNMDLETIQILDGNLMEEIEALETRQNLNDNLQGKSSLTLTTIGMYHMLKTKRGPQSDKRVSYNSLYLPAAIFVPAYGRLQLWEQMHRLGKRVLYHDTDSIIYEYIPGEYNIPEGEYWGQWEIDDKDQGIYEFVGVAPKSYGIRCLPKSDGSAGYEMIKFKGLSITKKHSKQINFDILKSMVLHWQVEGEAVKRKLPQQVWDYKFGQSIVTVPTIKEFGFDPENLKGPVSPLTLQQYPPGYILQPDD